MIQHGLESNRNLCKSNSFAVNSLQLVRKYINNSRHLKGKYARIFVRGHYLFREGNSFPRAKLKENCELRGTDNVQGQMSEHIFAPNADYLTIIPRAHEGERNNCFSKIQLVGQKNFQTKHLSLVKASL